MNRPNDVAGSSNAMNDINNVGKNTSKSTSMHGLINKDDLSVIQKEQKSMLEKMEKINQMLSNCNDISEQQLAKLLPRLQQHASALIDMKKNLDYIYIHVRHLKSVLCEKHPQLKSLPWLESASSQNDETSESTVTLVSGWEGASDQIETE